MSTPPFVIRAAVPADSEGVAALAQHLNSVNLPNDPAAIARLLQRSEASFQGAIADPTQREFVFVLLDTQSGQVVGTSMVIAQLGRRGSPYTFLRVGRVEKYSATLDQHFVHTVLSTRYAYEGPTEIGGLVVHPAQRRGGQRLGTQISFVRFLFVAMHAAEFQDEVLAELLPPLTPDGTSHLWEALGRRFTGLGYAEADRLSKTNKEFILSLFPEGEIFATLLSHEAQAVIGEVGEATKGVERMLRRIGFRYAERVDPFDGGPHYIARQAEIEPIRAARAVTLVPAATAHPARLQLIGRRYAGPPYFLACAAQAAETDGELRVAPQVARWLDAAGPGQTWTTPV